jgi:hypothetical protein
MATVSATRLSGEHNFGGENQVISWANLANGDEGGALQQPGFADRSVQIVGTFGAGGTLVLEGSNDGVNYVTLTDPQGNPLSITTAKIEQISEVTRFVRPRVTAGDGTTALSVHMLVKGQR